MRCRAASTGVNRMWSVVKRSLLDASRSVGVSAAIGRSHWRARRLLILGYHGVSLADEHVWSPPLYMAPDVFRHRLALLRRHRCSVLGLEEALARLAAGTLPPRAVTLTFDDGFHDFAVRALPLLEEFGYPATVYLTTHYVGRETPVFDVMGRYLLWRARGRRIRLGAVLDGAPSESPRAVRGETAYALATAAGRAAAWRALRHAVHVRGLDSAAKGQLLERLARALDVDYDALRAERILYLMTPREVAECADRRVTFALHTHRHRTPIDRSAFLAEIAINRRRLEAILPAPPAGGPSAAAASHFCYPSGHHLPVFEEWLAEAGVVSAVTCDPGLASAAARPLALPRVIDGAQVPAAVFEGWLTGAAALLPTRRGPCAAGVTAARPPREPAALGSRVR